MAAGMAALVGRRGLRVEVVNMRHFHNPAFWRLPIAIGNLLAIAALVYAAMTEWGR